MKRRAKLNTENTELYERVTEIPIGDVRLPIFKSLVSTVRHVEDLRQVDTLYVYRILTDDRRPNVDPNAARAVVAGHMQLLWYGELRRTVSENVLKNQASRVQRALESSVFDDAGSNDQTQGEERDVPSSRKRTRKSGSSAKKSAPAAKSATPRKRPSRAKKSAPAAGKAANVPRAEAAATETATDGKPRFKNVSKMIDHLLQTDTPDEEIVTLTKNAFPERQVTKGHVSWRRKLLKEKGAL